MNDVETFIKRLADVQDLMGEENYKEALKIIEELKEIERKGDFDYSLTHKLYQLDSNTRSLQNQAMLSKLLDHFSQSGNSVSFEELAQFVQESEEFDLDPSLLRREIELLILRGKLSCVIEGNLLKFL